MRLTVQGREYRAAVCSHMAALKLDNEGLDCRVEVYIRLNPPTNAKRDIDNFLKSPLDAITHSGFWVDDSIVDRLTVARGDKEAGGSILVTVMGIED